MNAHWSEDKFDISAEMAANVVKLKQPDPETDVEQMGDLHRRGILKYSTRIAATKRELKEAINTLELARKVIKAQFERDLAGIVEQIADAKDKANRDTEADKRLVAASRAALDALAE